MDHHQGDYMNRNRSAQWPPRKSLYANSNRSESASDSEDRADSIKLLYRQSASDLDDQSRPVNGSIRAFHPASNQKMKMKVKMKPKISTKALITSILTAGILLLYIIFSSSDYALRISSVWRPVRLSLVERLWNILRFILLTSAIFVGILSTSLGHAKKDGRNLNSVKGNKDKKVNKKEK